MEDYDILNRIENKDIKLISNKLLFDANQTKIFNAIPNIMLLLNKTRQIVYSNELLLKFAGFKSIDEVLGMRPGEVLKCNHAFENENGCGTSSFCNTCGAFNAILSSIRGQEDIQECRIIQETSGDAFDFRIWTTPITINNEEFIIFSIEDISSEKRRQVFERIFFHDIMNTATGFLSLSELLNIDLPSDYDEYKKYAKQLSSRLVDEIQAQRQLNAAEHNQLEIDRDIINTLDILNEIKDIYSRYEIAEQKEIIIDEKSVNINFNSDRAILGRVIANMLKNAIEATSINKTIKLGCFQNGEYIRFWVNNPTFIPEETQKQIFQRSFSTKGTGRGIGTYSIKLLTERFLKGNVGFKSTQEDGTTFFAEIKM